VRKLSTECLKILLSLTHLLHGEPGFDVEVLSIGWAVAVIHINIIHGLSIAKMPAYLKIGPELQIQPFTYFL
jgi:hypothetical protein